MLCASRLKYDRVLVERVLSVLARREKHCALVGGEELEVELGRTSRQHAQSRSRRVRQKTGFSNLICSQTCISFVMLAMCRKKKIIYYLKKKMLV